MIVLMDASGASEVLIAAQRASGASEVLARSTRLVGTPLTPATPDLTLLCVGQFLYAASSIKLFIWFVNPQK